MKDDVHVVTGMPDAYVANDASAIQLTFSTAGGDIKLSFDADQFDAFATRAIQLFTHVRNQKLAIGDHLAVRPVPVAMAAAESAVGGEVVVLRFVAQNGVPFDFSMSPEDAHKLRPELRNAVESARRQRASSRQ